MESKRKSVAPRHGFEPRYEGSVWNLQVADFKMAKMDTIGLVSIKGSPQRLVTHLGWSAVVQCVFIIPLPNAGNPLRAFGKSCSGQGLVQYRRTTSPCEPSDRTGSRYLSVEFRESLQTEPSLTSRGRLRLEHGAFNFFPMIAGSACKCYPLAGRGRAFVS